MTPHSWKSDRPVAKLTGRAICTGCGLLRLKNLLTEWCVMRGCDYQDHPQYDLMRRTLPAAHQRNSTPASTPVSQRLR